MMILLKLPNISVRNGDDNIIDKDISIIKQSDNDYPEKLRKIKNPPKELWISGNKEILKKPIIAIVGSRKCSEYGRKYAREFARVLSKNGICIISGLAIGIDTIVHESSMNELGKTIAVIASGFNKIMPAENRELADEIIEKGGAVINEVGTYLAENAENYPKRNRILVGLSDAIIVIEARLRSGSTLTGRMRT